MSETAATLKRKASLSPPAQDVTSKRVKEDETTEGDSNVNTRSSSNRGVGEKSEVGDNTTPPAAPPKRESEPESTPLPTLTGSDVRGKSPEQTRRPSGSAAPASGPGPERDTGPGAARKSIALDEKKRAKRLFGGILGTLSQSQPSTHQRKRLDVDRRQQERVQKQREESDKIRADKLAKRKAIREKEQEKLEEEMMEARHSRMLAMARSLRTRGEPRLYYQPFELTNEQEDIIDEQISEAKETIKRELREFRLRRGISDDSHSHSRKEPEPDKSGGRSSPSPKTTVGEGKNSSQDTNHEPTPVIASSHSTKYKDPDDNGEEMVQDKEDTVIY